MSFLASIGRVLDADPYAVAARTSGAHVSAAIAAGVRPSVGFGASASLGPADVGSPYGVAAGNDPGAGPNALTIAWDSSKPLESVRRGLGTTARVGARTAGAFLGNVAKNAAEGATGLPVSTLLIGAAVVGALVLLK